MPKVAVTGAKGRVGQFVVRELLEQGHAVKALTHSPWEECPVEQARISITDYASLKDALDGCDAVVHLAAIPWARPGDDLPIFDTNVTGTYALLLAAGESGIRRVSVASSDCALGFTFSHQETTPDYLPVDETHPARPDNSYGMSKVAAEGVADGLAKRFGMSIASLRISWVTGPEQYRKDSRFWRTTEDPEAGPWNLWSYIDGRDAAQAFRLGIETDLGGHEVFCIAEDNSRVNLPSRELAARYFPNAEIRGEFEGTQSFENNAKAKRLLGFAPRYRWDEAGAE
jgi:nucleoside-diphosphate-sugar epimerase